MSDNAEPAAPTSRQDILNERTRVTEWRLVPGASTGPHTHEYDYVIVPITRSRMRLELPDGTVTHADLEPGVSYFRQTGNSHNVFNDGDGVMIFVEVELLEKAAG